jgi:S1-C subfamily serine protease
MTRRDGWALWCVLLCGPGCGPRADPGQPGREVIEEPGPPPHAEAPARPAGARRSGQVSRADLNQVLDAGPGAFLARAEVKARLVKGQFHGWEVIRTPYPDIDLVAGDVLLAVNGRVLEHPVDLEQLWNDLRAAKAIDVDVERGGSRFALRFTVVPAP